MDRLIKQYDSKTTFHLNEKVNKRNELEQLKGKEFDSKESQELQERCIQLLEEAIKHHSFQYNYYDELITKMRKHCSHKWIIDSFLKEYPEDHIKVETMECEICGEFHYKEEDTRDPF